jgi:3'-phosphoadenosine 5'-phosphosulfate sulfotransferase (PAPS reductase)/FAD synthetase
MIIHVISISAGKDSTATMLIAMMRFGKDRCRFVFADIGNEHPAVYEYLDYLERLLGIEIVRLRASFNQEIANKRMFIARDQRKGRKNGRKVRWTNKAKRRALALLRPSGNPFLDLCMLKGRFPSRKAQFCTQELKTGPLVEYQLGLVDAGHTVVSWQGIRRDESLNRRNAKKFEKLNPGIYAYRPIVDWTAQETVNFVIGQGLALNPLYSQGMSRVGCMPCINANKEELRQIAARFPEHIARIDEWEHVVGSVSKRQAATFIPAPGIRPDQARQHGIYSVIKWAKTSRGGRQASLLADLPPETCSSQYGLCE